MSYIHIQSMTNPVSQSYGGGEQINVRQLGEFCEATRNNIQTLTAAVNLARTKTDLQNETALKFINWLATTNPKVLDEFKAVATTLDKLEPRDDGGETTAFAAA